MKKVIKYVLSFFRFMFLRIASIFIIKNNKDIFIQNDFKNLNNYIREDYILNNCKDKKVLHFGFLDSPFLVNKIKDGNLLHQKIKNISNSVFGVDINLNDLKLYREESGDINNEIYNIEEADLPDSLNDNFDIIVLGEILEHLRNPFIALQRLFNLSKLNNAKVLISVPNVYNSDAFAYAIGGRELIHPDHYYYFSPFTITKLMKEAGFKNIELSTYSSKTSFYSPGITKNGLLVLAN